MEHPAVTHINAHMGNAGGIVCPGEEHQISGLGVTDTGTDVIQPLGTQPPEVPTALIIDPRYIAGAVKGCAGLVPAPYIGIADILLGLLVDGGKGLVGKVFLRGLHTGTARMCICPHRKKWETGLCGCQG